MRTLEGKELSFLLPGRLEGIEVMKQKEQIEKKLAKARKLVKVYKHKPEVAAQFKAMATLLKWVLE